MDIALYDILFLPGQIRIMDGNPVLENLEQHLLGDALLQRFYFGNGPLGRGEMEGAHKTPGQAFGGRLVGQKKHCLLPLLFGQVYCRFGILIHFLPGFQIKPFFFSLLTAVEFTVLECALKKDALPELDGAGFFLQECRVEPIGQLLAFPQDGGQSDQLGLQRVKENTG